MKIDKLEIGKNHEIITINDLESFNLNDLNERNYNHNIKVDIHLENLNSLGLLHQSKLLDMNNLHIRLSFTKQNYLMLNTSDIMKKSIIKSISVFDMIIVLELFTTNEVSDFIFQNNIKVIERLNYLSNDIQIHSKNHEILYQANLILKELQKSDNKIRNVRQRIEKLNDFMIN